MLYIGETGKSSYERGKQHLSDAQQLKPSSHMLKHFLDCHEEEKLESMKFSMKIRTGAKSAFERQVTESVIIQQETSSHNILNSKAEYNRCALPRLTTKLGDKDFEAWKVEKQEEKKKEEELERKIRILRKERNKERRPVSSWNNLPAEKKRKLDWDRFKKVKQIEEKKREKRERDEEEADSFPDKVSKRVVTRDEETEKDVDKLRSKTPSEDQNKEKSSKLMRNWDEEIVKYKIELEKEIITEEEKNWNNWK